MSKKDALTLACEEFNHLIYSGKTGIGCGDCPAVKDCELNCESYSVKNCTKILKKYFQQQSDIPDGWDVVKEIRDEAINNYYDVETSNHAHDAGVLNEAKHIANYAYCKLRDAEIEEE